MLDSKQSFTPAPWSQYANGDQIYGADGFFITVVQSKNKFADARLIAAAPDLLAACRKAGELLEYGGFDLGFLDEAIAKAGG